MRCIFWRFSRLETTIWWLFILILTCSGRCLVSVSMDSGMTLNLKEYHSQIYTGRNWGLNFLATLSTFTFTYLHTSYVHMNIKLHAGMLESRYQTSNSTKKAFTYGHHCVQVYLNMSDLHHIVIRVKRHVDLWSLVPILGVHQVHQVHVIKGHSHGGAPIHWSKGQPMHTQKKCLQLDNDKTIQQVFHSVVAQYFVHLDLQKWVCRYWMCFRFSSLVIRSSRCRSGNVKGHGAKQMWKMWKRPWRCAWPTWKSWVVVSLDDGSFQHARSWFTS